MIHTGCNTKSTSIYMLLARLNLLPRTTNISPRKKEKRLKTRVLMELKVSCNSRYEKNNESNQYSKRAQNHQWIPFALRIKSKILTTHVPASTSLTGACVTPPPLPSHRISQNLHQALAYPKASALPIPWVTAPQSLRHLNIDCPSLKMLRYSYFILIFTIT